MDIVTSIENEVNNFFSQIEFYLNLNKWFIICVSIALIIIFFMQVGITSRLRRIEDQLSHLGYVLENDEGDQDNG